MYKKKKKASMEKKKKQRKKKRVERSREEGSIKDQIKKENSNCRAY